MLAPDNPDSPYNNLAGAGAPSGSVRGPLVTQLAEGTYEGPVNEDGRRHGIGKCAWVDGSYYEGDWALGVRHGNGIYKNADGAKYEG